ncbi:unnamed protein product [Ilex paraguariensis]|uniref:Myb-like domain-containing protein n=1 Tax=Ilex paraguariensis TaxID=185542 RepID=A0ABC8RKP2_9AQUA
MGPPRKSRSVNKGFSYIDELSPSKDGENSKKNVQRMTVLGIEVHYQRQKRKVSDMLGAQWSKTELERFYEAYRKYGVDWKKVAAAVGNRSVEMVETLYSMNMAYLSLPEGTASIAGLIAMMTDHYSNLAGSDSEQESNDGSDGRALLHSATVTSSYGCLSLLKKRSSGGSRPRAVGKRTPRVPVKYFYMDVEGEKLFSATRQAQKLKVDANDDEDVHAIAIALVEASQRGGSPQLAETEMTSAKLVGSDRGEVGLQASLEVDKGESSRDRSCTRVMESVGTVDKKGRGHYGKKLEVDDDCTNHLDDFKEACSGTEGQKLGKVMGKFVMEVTDAKISRFSSQGLRKRSKKVLFEGDEGSTFDALQTLADLSLRMPSTTEENEPSVLVQRENDDLVAESMPAIHQRDKSLVVGAIPEAKEEPHHSVTKLFSEKQKILASKTARTEARSDTRLSGSQEAEIRDAGKKSVTKGRRSP